MPKLQEEETLMVSSPPTVCFITPPSPFLMDERVFPALGILKVAATARQQGYPVEHLDLNGVGNAAEVAGNHAQNTGVEVFAITATTPQLPAATEIAKVLHQVQPDCRVILGGPHSTLTLAALKHSTRAVTAMAQLKEDFDVVIAGDGEDAIQLALEDSPPSVINADDPKGDLFLTAKRLEELPLPARDLVDLTTYHYDIDGTNVTPLVSQLGCPFGCNFCAGRDSSMLRRTRIRSTESVIAELRHLYQVYGYHGFMFFDDELNVNPKLPELLLAMLKLQDELGIEFRCRGFVKAELFTTEQADLMYQAGFRKIMCGFESGSDRILKNINKNATKDDNTRAMEISHKYGLGMKALMSLGHPGESSDTVHETLHWLVDVEPEDFDCTIITAYPGSPYYDQGVHIPKAVQTQGEAWGFEANGDWLYMKDLDYSTQADFYKGALGDYKSYVWTDDLNAEELVKGRDFIERFVREKLDIPYYHATAAERFEASMGALPGHLYRQGGEAS